jgi:hypothetical protein
VTGRHVFGAAALTCAVLVASGCGQTHHVLPPAPLRAGEVAVAAHLQWSPGAPAFPVSLGAGLYVGVTSRDVVGGSLSAIFLPSALSVAHYEPLGGGAWLALQGHLSNLYSASVMTTADAVAVASFPTDAGYQSVRAGVGVVAPLPVAGWLAGRDTLRGPRLPVVPLPILGVQLRLKDAVLDVQVRPGLTRAFVRHQRRGLQAGYDAATGAAGPIVLTRDDVASVERDTTSRWQRRWPATRVHLADGGDIWILPRDPYPDCTGCALKQGALDAHAPTDAHHLYWISLPTRFTPAYPDGGGMLLVELDMAAVLAEWERDGVLRLTPSPEAAEQAARRVRFPADLSVSIGGAGIARDPAGAP